MLLRTSSSTTYFSSPIIFASAIALRTVLLLYGLFQDAYSPVKYTDIDYFVFTDAARYVSLGLSPYQRETYRYTPLLAWLLLPTTWPSPVWFSFGKVLFALADILAGYLIIHVLQSRAGGGMTPERALRFASIWLLNPMVATISTRGSSEGLLCTMVVALLSAVIHRQIKLAGVLLGLGVHFKIYPFIYGTSIIWCLDESQTPNKFERDTCLRLEPGSTIRKLLNFMNPARLTLVISSLATFTALNLLMYTIYSGPFLTHTFVHHLTRVDHRHNFSPYNILLYQSSSSPKSGRFPFESLAFGPQLALSAFLIPVCLAKKDLPGAMLAQTFAFVSFNKVCTSQYFLWYMILLPFYLRYSSFLSSPTLGLKAAALWVISQAMWLYQAYHLEFHGHSTFIPGLLLSSFFFFSVNVWVLGIIIADIESREFNSTQLADDQISELHWH